MRTIPAALQTHLDGEVISLSKCIKITRSDNAVIRLTTHDRDLTVGGEVYRSDIGLSMSALQSSSDLSVDNAEMTLGLDEVLLLAEDFKFGLYDKATFEYFLVNWEDTSDGQINMKRGEFGDITLNNDTSVTIQLRGLTQSLQRQIVEKYSPTCRVNLGGLKCGVVNTPLRIRRDRQKVKTWDWFLVPNTNITAYGAGTNMDFETDGVVANGTSGITGWSYGSGSYWQVEDAFTAGDGTYYLEGGNDGAGASTGTEFTLYKTITTADLGMVNGDIDAGELSIDWNALIAGTSSSVENPGRVSIEQLDASGNTLRLDYSQYITPEYQVWQGIGLTAFVLPNCRSIRFGLHARKNNGASATVAFDTTSIRFWTNTLATFGSRVFRTVRIPSYGVGEAYAFGNASFESGSPHANSATAIPGWSYDAGAFFSTAATAGPLTPTAGGFLFRGGDNGTTTNDQVYSAFQTLPIPGSPTAQNITDGWYYTLVTVDYAKLDADSDARMTLEFLDAADSVVDTLDTGYDTGGTIEEWRTFSLGARVPSTATQIRVKLYARSGIGSAANVVFDNLEGFSMVTAYEQAADADYGLLDSAEPTYDYTTDNYTIDGEALVQCRVPAFDFATVTGVTDKRTFAASSINQTAALMYSGKIVWLSGNNAGKTSFVRVWDNTGKVARMYDDVQNTIQIGDTFVYAIGCDKTIARCADTFGNAHNFRGEPYLPGPARVVEFLTTGA